MKSRLSGPRIALATGACAFMIAAGVATSATEAGAAAPSTLDLNILLIGEPASGGVADATTAAWESALTTEGVPYTEVDASGTAPDQTITLPALSSGTTGYFNGVVFADTPVDFASGQLSALYTYESTFGVRQVDGYMFPDPALGATYVTTDYGSLDGTTGTLTAAGLAAFPELAGPVPFPPVVSGATQSYGYGATINTGAPYTTLITDAAGNSLAGIYQHPSTDAQAGVGELSLYFNYSAAQLQWLLLAPGLINWVTQGTHLGQFRNYVEMDIDDTFTPDDAWDTTNHTIDYADGDSLRMTPPDVITSSEWSQANHFRLDQLFNYGSTVAAQAGDLDFAGSTVDSDTAGPDPLLAQFQATDPATGKPYTDDYGWISHTYDTPYLDVGCATQNYIEAELNENSSSIAAAPGATAGTGGLGITENTNDSLTYGAEDPQVFVPGNHSGFADLVPGNPATVDEPDLDNESAGTGGSLAAGTYQYAVTDQFTGAPVTTNLGPAGESAAYVTGPITVPANGSVSLQWEAICHAANYNIYREVAGSNDWTLIGNYYTPASSTLPDNSSGDPLSTTDVTNGGESELTFTDSGSTSAECQGDSGYCVSAPAAAPWTTPPVTENAEESPWEQNPYFIPAMEAVGITAVGDDASKPYPDPPTDEFGIGASYTGTEYAAGQTFVDGTAQVVPRHPINVYYNASTDAQELDEYNTLYPSSTPATLAGVVNSVVAQMLQFMLTNNPEPSYVHQTNLMGILPGCTDAEWAAGGDVAGSGTCATPPSTTCTDASCMPTTPDTTGDGTLYSVLDPLLTEYDSYFNDNSTNTGSTPFVQLTEGQIATVLANQSAWSANLTSTASDISASETNGVVTLTNTGTSAVEVPVSVPKGTNVGTASLSSYGGQLSGWVDLAAGSSVTLAEAVAPSITSAATATANVGAAFSFTVGTTGEPAPALTESGALPAGITFTDNGNGTATIAGTSTSGSGGTYPLTITATNGAGSATQSFTLTNTEAPTITSPATATFTTTVPGTYNITTTGYPAPTLTETAGTLPAGLAFVDNGNGTGTISGTAAAGSQGTYPVTISATNPSDDSTATLALVITVDPATAPTISVGSADFTLGAMGSVAVTTTGYPTPSITETGTLPAGLTFVDNGHGTALLSGIPTATGTTTLTIDASNGISPDATTALTVIVSQAPAITSADTASATVGSPFSFTVTTTGYPTPSIGETGLPADLSFVDNGDGTATISGTPSAGDAGTYSVDLSAVNLGGTTPQTLTLDIGTGQAPAITSASSATATVGTAFSFTVSTTGTPTPALSESGALPAGLTFTDNGDGTATLSGTPTATGKATVTVKASNGVSPDATQAFTINVGQAPAITSAGSASGTAGSPFSFTVTATGYPAPSVTETGLPADLSFVDNGDGTATISGTPPAADAGTYSVDLSALNAAGSASQTLSLTIGSAAPAPPSSPTLPTGPAPTPTTGPAPTPAVSTVPTAGSVTPNQAPAFSSPSSLRATVGHNLSFKVTASGYPVPSLADSPLPGGLRWVNDGNGTATISGAPTAAAAGVSKVLLTARNVMGSTEQVLTITVQRPAGLTNGKPPAATVGRHYSFTVRSYGYPTPLITVTGTLPAGLEITRTRSGEAILWGIPAATSAGLHPITVTVTNSLGKATGHYALTIGEAPAITSEASVDAGHGAPFSFRVKTSGYPHPWLTHTALPSGLKWANNSGTATISGTPTATAVGAHRITITAKNAYGTVRQVLTIKVS